MQLGLLFPAVRDGERLSTCLSATCLCAFWGKFLFHF